MREPHPDLPAVHAALQRTLTSRHLYLLFSELHFLSVLAPIKLLYFDSQ